MGVILYDDFPGSVLDSTKWDAMNRVGDLGNSEDQCYQPGQVSVSSSNLVITAQNTTQSCGDAFHAPSSQPYLSAMLQSKVAFAPQGSNGVIIEVKAKLPGGTGPWPAIWMLGQNCQSANVMSADNQGVCQWPNAGSDEIDFIERLNNDLTHLNQQIHSGSNNDGGLVACGFDTSAAFHVYGLTWRSGLLIWYLDGVESSRITGAHVPSTSMFLLMNIAVGGNGGGTPNPATFPQTMQVDYVSIIQESDSTGDPKKAAPVLSSGAVCSSRIC
jgi:beta-glucanase (GH16 family)